jgi:hypothetical protein
MPPIFESRGSDEWTGCELAVYPVAGDRRLRLGVAEDGGAEYAVDLDGEGARRLGLALLLWMRGTDAERIPALLDDMPRWMASDLRDVLGRFDE